LRAAQGESDRVRGIAAALRTVAGAMDEGRDCGQELDELVVQLRGVRRRSFGASRQAGSARARIGALLVRRVGEWVTGEELSAAAGISEWARRIRELRESGYKITESGGSYRLEELPRD
jgi:biotin operon repressor